MTQITMEAAGDTEFLDAMNKANVKGALVGVESVTPEGLKSVYKDFNMAGDDLVRQLQRFREHKVYILGSFIFGLATDRPETFNLTADIAHKAGVVFAQFVPLTPLPGTVDFLRWEEEVKSKGDQVAGVPLSRYWLIPQTRRPKMYTPHPVMSAAEITERTQGVWDRFLQAAENLAALQNDPNHTGSAHLPVDIQTLPADVCEIRLRHRQCPNQSGKAMDELDREAVSTPVPGGPDAGSAGAPKHISRRARR